MKKCRKKQRIVENIHNPPPQCVYRFSGVYSARNSASARNTSAVFHSALCLSNRA